MTTAEHTFSIGDRVRFTANSLGVLTTPDSLRFADETVGVGDVGVVAVGDVPEGWIMVETNLSGDRLGYVPVHPAMIEKA
jgi:hypothetical protein